MQTEETISAARFGRILAGRPFLHGVLSLAGGTALGQAVLLAATPLFTRLYRPDEIGKLGLFSTYLIFCSTGVALAYDMAIVSEKDPGEADSLSLVGLLLVVPTSIIAAVLSLIFMRQGYFGYGVFPSWAAVLIGLGALVNGWLFVFRYRCIRDQKFTVIRRIPIYQNTARAVTQILFGFLKFGWVGLCIGELIGRGLGLETVAKEVGQAIKHSWKLLNPQHALCLLKRYKEFPLYIFPSSFIGSVAQSMPLLFIAMYYGLFAAGFFALLQRVLAMPMTLIGTSVADVFHARFAEVVNQGKDSPKPLLLKTAFVLLLIGAGPAVLVMLWGPSIFAFVLGDSWREAGRYAVYIAPWALIQLAVNPVSRVVAVLDGKKLKLIYDLSSLLGTALVFWVAHRMAASIYVALFALSWVNVLTYVIYFAILFRVVSKHENSMQHYLGTPVAVEN